MKFVGHRKNCHDCGNYRPKKNGSPKCYIIRKGQTKRGWKEKKERSIPRGQLRIGGNKTGRLKKKPHKQGGAGRPSYHKTQLWGRERVSVRRQIKALA